MFVLQSWENCCRIKPIDLKNICSTTFAKPASLAVKKLEMAKLTT